MSFVSSSKFMCYFSRNCFIEKVHLDDLDLYVKTFIALATSVFSLIISIETY